MAEYIKVYGELRRPLEGQFVTDADQVKYGDKNVKETLDALGGIKYIDVPDLESDYVIQAGDIHKETVYTIEIGSTVHSIMGDSTIHWVDGEAPITKENCTYVISVVGTLAVWGEFPNS